MDRQQKSHHCCFHESLSWEPPQCSSSTSSTTPKITPPFPPSAPEPATHHIFAGLTIKMQFNWVLIPECVVVKKKPSAILTSSKYIQRKPRYIWTARASILNKQHIIYNQHFFFPPEKAANSLRFTGLIKNSQSISHSDIENQGNKLKTQTMLVSHLNCSSIAFICVL